jgi:RHS repeat-associated protein
MLPLKRQITLALFTVFFTSSTLALQAGPGGPGGPGGPPHSTDYYYTETQPNISNYISPLGENIFNEIIDPQMGELSFTATDIAIPGNFDLPVRLTRIRHPALWKSHSIKMRKEVDESFGDWRLDFPHMYWPQSEFLTMNFETACGNATQRSHGFGYVMPNPSHSAPILYVNGSGKTLRIPLASAAGNYPSGTDYITEDNWIAKCNPIDNGSFELVVYSPEGDEYLFNNSDRSSTGFFYATKVTDKNGNWVKYEDIYSTSGRIHSSDGREINLHRDSVGGKITQADANGKSWYYSYNNLYVGTTISSLYQATRPDNKSFTYQYVYPNFTPSSHVSRHTVINSEVQYTFSHPEGASTNFVLKTNTACIGKVFGFTGFHFCTDSPGGSKEDMRWYARVASKTITTPTNSYNWLYTYSNDAFSTSRTLSIAGPDKTQKFTFEGAFGLNKLVKEEVLENSTGSALETVTHTYEQVLNNGISCPLTAYTYGYNATVHSGWHYSLACEQDGSPASWIYDDGTETASQSRNYIYDMHKYRRTSSVITRGTDLYTTEILSYNIYHNPVTLKEFNNFSSNTRYKKINYLSSLSANYVNAQLDTYQLSTNGTSWTTVVDLDYDSNWNVNSFKSFGRTFWSVATRHSDGNVKKIEFGNGLRWQEYNDYYRGHPRSILLPNRYASGSNSFSQTVNNDGTIANQTDRNGNLTSYQYDPLSRLTNIDIGDSSFSDTNISYRSKNTTDPSFYTGPLVAEVTRGNYQQTTYYDYLLRPNLIRTRDTSDNSSSVYVKRQFNIAGQATFASYPSTTANPTIGIETTFDALGRLTKSQETNTSYNTNFSYISGNRVTTTDANNQSITTTYLAWGAPQTNLATYIAAPHGVNTAISYNLFENITQVTQGGKTQKWVYDNYQDLCKSYTPESNWQYTSFDTEGKLEWYAKGVIEGSDSCNRGNVAASKKVFHYYDNQGVLEQVNYSDSTLDINYTIDGNGNPLTISNSEVVLDYSWNSQNLVESEQMSIDGFQFSLDKDYNSLSQINSVQYPSGRSITFSPDATGLTSSILGIVSDVSYSPTRQPSYIQFNNGVTISNSFDSRLLPSSSVAKNSGNTTLVSHSFSFDGVKNLIGQTDNISSNYSMILSYDGLSRLTAASGYWGSGSINYDTLGNITSKVLGSQSINYLYDVSNRLSSVSGSVTKSYTYDASGSITNNGAYSLIYNQAGQTVSASSTTMRYDGNSKRVAKQTSSGTIYTMYDSNGTVFYQRRADGTEVDTIYLANKPIAEIEKIAGNDTYKYIHTDLLGSPIAEINSSQSVTSRLYYKPFGEMKNGMTGGVGYTGHIQDTELDLVYMQARYYDPVIGRFYSNDPVDAVSHLSNEEGIKGFNRYSYAVNNPYKYTDPDGKAICGGICIGVAIIAAKVGPKIYKAYKTYKSNKRIQKVLKNKQSTGKKGEQTSSSGSKGADKDFKTLTKGSDVKTYENGTKVGKTPDGRTVDKHGSSGKSGKGADVKKGTDSIKIKNESGKTKTTIRYPEN